MPVEGSQHRDREALKAPQGAVKTPIRRVALLAKGLRPLPAKSAFRSERFGLAQRRLWIIRGALQRNEFTDAVRPGIETMPAIRIIDGADDKIAFHRFHVSPHLSRAVDSVRRQKHKQFKLQLYPNSIRQ